MDIKPEIRRVTRSKEQAKKSYDKMSRFYDLLSQSSEKKYKKVGLEMLDAKEGEKTLEIGFGTGHCIVAMAKSVGDSGKVYGIDISDGMLKISENRVEKEGLTKRVELTTGDAAKLPYEDDMFDAMFMSFTLELFDTPEIPVVLAECARVLRSKGRLSVISMLKKEKETVAVRIYEWSHKTFPKFVDCRPIYVKKELEDAGFSIPEAKEMSMWRLPVGLVLAFVKRAN